MMQGPSESAPDGRTNKPKEDGDKGEGGKGEGGKTDGPCPSAPMCRAIASRTSDSDRALRNLLERDRLFTERLRDVTTQLGLRTIDVDLDMTKDDLSAQVTSAFGL